MGATVFLNCLNLREAAGLEAAIHMAPSALDPGTLRAAGALPEPFLRGVGYSLRE